MTLNKDKAKFSQVIGYKDSDSMHLLFEILQFLELQKNETLEFNMPEINLHTKTRIDRKAQPLIDKLTEDGYIEKMKHGKMRVIKNPWQ